MLPLPASDGNGVVDGAHRRTTSISPPREADVSAPWRVVLITCSVVLCTAAPTAGPGVSAAMTTSCPSNLADQLQHRPGSAQLITVIAKTARSQHAVLQLWQRSGPCFRSVGGPWPAEVGVDGLSSEHVEGDGTTPIGTFSIAPVFYGVLPDPGVHFAYHQLVCGDWWDEDSRSRQYNTFQHLPCGAKPAFGANSEALWRTIPAYDYFAVIDYNVAPVVPGRGSGIFLHLSTGGPTAGCVSIDKGPLLEVFRWMRPTRHPAIVISLQANLASL